MKLKAVDKKNIVLDDIFQFIESKSESTLDDDSYDLDDYYKKKEQRIIHLNQEIDDSLIETIAYQIIDYNLDDMGIPYKDRKPIKLLINTSGGDIVTMFHLIDVIEASDTPVYTYCLGKAHSAGAYILMSGHKRFAFPNSHVLIHAGEITMDETFDKMYDVVEYANEIKASVKDIILNNTTITEATYDENFRKEWYIMGYELLDYGVVDEIVESLSTLVE